MAKHYKDISGQKFGRLTALYRLHNLKGDTKWLCICDCGNLSEVKSKCLSSGETKSCGCLKLEIFKSNVITHGKSNTRIYDVWKVMLKRCYNKNNKMYKHYGGRGVAVYSKWKDDFEAFYEWSMANGYKEGLTLDRINVNGNYEPNNCRWVTMKQQNRNKRNNKYITINGVTRCLSEWCELLGLKYGTIQSRLKRGWNIEQAFELVD